MADPDDQLGFAYVTNEMGFRLFDDVREKRDGGGGSQREGQGDCDKNAFFHG